MKKIRAERGSKYPKKDVLPPNAITVKIFSIQIGVKVGYVYVKFERGKADYEIINFQGINFVIPNN